MGNQVTDEATHCLKQIKETTKQSSDIVQVRYALLGRSSVQTFHFHLNGDAKYKIRSGCYFHITIENTGTEPLTLPNAILGLTVENAVTHEKYPLFSAQVITVLDSGGAKSLKWDQRDLNRQQVGETPLQQDR